EIRTSVKRRDHWDPAKQTHSTRVYRRAEEVSVDRFRPLALDCLQQPTGERNIEPSVGGDHLEGKPPRCSLCSHPARPDKHDMRRPAAMRHTFGAGEEYRFRSAGTGCIDKVQDAVTGLWLQQAGSRACSRIRSY